MKMISNLLFFILVMCSFSFAQSQLPEFHKAKQIKFLQSTREDVKRIFADYEHDDSDDDYHSQSFSTKNAEIEVSFSEGDCSNDYGYWNVAEWVVTKIAISPENPIKVKDFNFSNFTKKMKNEKSSESYSYQNEKLGIVFIINGNEIDKIVLFPPKSDAGFLCVNENTSEILSGEKQLIDLILQEESGCTLRNFPPNVTELNLSATEIKVVCNTAANAEICLTVNQKVSLITTAIDPENDVLTYEYRISGGKIVGAGAKVIWDLSGVQPGIYTVTARVDDGGAIRGATITKDVIVIKCADCSENQKAIPQKP